MNRTKKLMATISTSLFFASEALPGPRSAAFAQSAAQRDEAWKSDPEVGKAAEDILGWLQGTTIENAKTKSDIAQHFPKLSASLIDNALKRLTVYDRALIQTGYGTEAAPYRYYEYATSGRGHGG
jgi:hypothetical protein